MEITYYIERQYGIERTYIADEATARSLRALTRRTTLDARDIEALKALGYTLKEVIKPR